MKLIQRLNQPEREFTPIPFWFLNGDLRDEEIRRQLQDFGTWGIWCCPSSPNGTSKANRLFITNFFSLYKNSGKRGTSAGYEDCAV